MNNRFPSPLLALTGGVVKHFENLILKQSLKKNLFNSITILLSGVLTVSHLFEYYTVAIRKEIEFYPFGGEGPVPYYYRTAELYSIVNLTYGLIFGFLFSVAIWNLWSNKIKAVTLFELIIIAVFLLLIHGWIN